MNLRSLLPSFLVIVLLASILSCTAQPDSSDNRLAVVLRLAKLTPDDWQVLFSEAESGNAEAQYWLGRIYDEGRLLPKDAKKSLDWYQKSAGQSYARAEYTLCLMHANHEESEGEHCMWRAAEKGVPEVQFWIGIAYDQQLWFGIADKHEAFKWFRRAAEGGCPEAELVMGEHYENGDEVEQDYTVAAMWYLKAAEHVPNLGGAGGGRSALGNLYMEGLGVPQDYVQAYKWFSLAGANKSIGGAIEKMNAEQIHQAEQLAGEWKEQHPDPAIY